MKSKMYQLFSLAVVLALALGMMGFSPRQSQPPPSKTLATRS
jgi:hypothetical protein